MKPDRWCVGTEEAFYGSYASKEEAISGAPLELDGMLGPGSTFYVGRCVPFVARINVYSLIEHLREEATEEAGEAAEEWLAGYEYPPADSEEGAEAADLSDRLNAVFAAWLKETHQEPEFYGVEDVTRHLWPTPQPAGTPVSSAPEPEKGGAT
jgi:hypothetical protein